MYHNSVYPSADMHWDFKFIFIFTLMEMLKKLVPIATVFFHLFICKSSFSYDIPDD